MAKNKMREEEKKGIRETLDKGMRHPFSSKSIDSTIYPDIGKPSGDTTIPSDTFCAVPWAEIATLISVVLLVAQV